MLREPLFNSHQSASFPDWSIDCRSVKGTDWAKIYNLYQTEQQLLSLKTEWNTFLNFQNY